MRYFSKIGVLVFFIFYNNIEVFASYVPWSDWQALDDRALKGISFSWKCADGICKWRWKNGYTRPIQLEYNIKYTSNGQKLFSEGVTGLQVGKNELNEYSVVASSLDGVSVSIVATEEAKQKARKQQTLVEEERQLQQEREEIERLEREERQQVERQERMADEEERRQREQEYNREFQQQFQSAMRDINGQLAAINRQNWQNINNAYEQAGQREQARAKAAADAERQSRLNELQRRKDDQKRREQELQARIRAEDERTREAEQQRQQERERIARQQAEERERKRKENSGSWREGYYKVTAWGADKLVQDSYMSAWVVDKSNSAEHYGQYLRITNNSPKYTASYATHHYSGTLQPNEEKILHIPFNNGRGTKRPTEYQLKVKWFVPE